MALPYQYAPSPVASSSTSSTPWPPQPPSITHSPVVQQQPSQHFYAPIQPGSVYQETFEGEKEDPWRRRRLPMRLLPELLPNSQEDQAAVINPDVDTPFQDEYDVVKRLLPYHIYQQPRDDLQFILNGGKGKGKSVDRGLKAEIQETKFAIECCERLERLRRRWRNVKIREGQHASPSDQAYVLAQAVVETERTETALLTGELKATRSELERIQKEQRIAANAARMTQYPPSVPNPVPTTTAPPTPISTQHYYRSYPYNYAQPYANSVPQAPVTTTTTFSVSVAPSPAPSTPQTSYSPAAYQSGGAIPVQLPVSSLPGLHQLGIVPVPANSLPPEGQPQPPAILRGSTSNGTMLSLEINVSLLQSSQMTGLAMMLNSLVARNASAMAGSTPATPVAASPHPAPANAAT
ncbi:hypothetical protein BKA70DRAFT_1424911 [Coprinopsis sp. MPI-PUGE-AT-0042]|nr:hypothetical protein BKA70DRAFT_1424911 [Coprinopsis sp. MPI-PUGE-AT-0042]